MEKSFYKITNKLFFYYRLFTSTKRAFPHFIIIGAQRSGTTSLYSMLCQHPQIKKAFRKEVHFFDNNFYKGVNWYKAHFPLRSVLKNSNSITGEASPYYMFHPFAIPRIKNTCPDAKLIVILRNPVYRAYSHYKHEIKRGIETMPTFEEAIKRENERLKNVSYNFMEKGYSQNAHQNYTYITRGKYLFQIKRVFEYFDKSQVFIDCFENFKNDSVRFCNLVFDFLEIKKFNITEEHLNKTKGEDLSQATKEKLKSYYADDNNELFEYLGRTFPWE